MPPVALPVSPIPKFPELSSVSYFEGSEKFSDVEPLDIQTALRIFLGPTDTTAGALSEMKDIGAKRSGATTDAIWSVFTGGVSRVTGGSMLSWDKVNMHDRQMSAKVKEVGGGWVSCGPCHANRQDHGVFQRQGLQATSNGWKIQDSGSQFRGRGLASGGLVIHDRETRFNDLRRAGHAEVTGVRSQLTYCQLEAGRQSASNSNILSTKMTDPTQGINEMCRASVGFYRALISTSLELNGRLLHLRCFSLKTPQQSWPYRHQYNCLRPGASVVSGCICEGRSTDNWNAHWQ
ncbi:hypothetical protein B0H14DRAFT_2592520 [Mycena olivaceomarginata]|nr:hypothetical protein B0H14DRAFT_2592520 [Mycena olivaceomarginata]